MNTHEEYVTYAQAVALKDLGFDWPCLNFYIADVKMTVCHSSRPFLKAENHNHEDVKDNRFSAPTQAVACRWLREEKGIIVLPISEFYDGDSPEIVEWGFCAMPLKNIRMQKRNRGSLPTYESALSAGIDRALELLTQNNKQQ